jgi:hypothetical protein
MVLDVSTGWDMYIVYAPDWRISFSGGQRDSTKDRNATPMTRIVKDIEERAQDHSIHYPSSVNHSHLMSGILQGLSRRRAGKSDHWRSLSTSIFNNSHTIKVVGMPAATASISLSLPDAIHVRTNRSVDPIVRKC